MKQVELFSPATKRNMRALHRAVGDVEQIADAMSRPGAPIFVRIPTELREALDEQIIAYNRNRAPGTPRRTLTDEVVERIELTFSPVPARASKGKRK